LAAAAALGAAALQSACGDGESLQGMREPCSNASGTLLGCDDMPIESPEDACWRLVECGVIPLEHEDDDVLDWATCVRMIERMSEARYEFALQCIETSSCDDLKVSSGSYGSPVDPRRWDMSIPLCLQYGDPP
jgi:hypothetical protein